ncbi:MAG: cyclase family protein [Phycisphaerae bacterium]|nr:cyclase family protein [Phycisphaerae bacterium]
MTNTTPAIWDITPPITPALAVWPGDTPPSREVLCTIEGGASVTLSTLRATVHLGAHADGPNHYGAGAPAIHERALERYLGPCDVVRATVQRGARVRLDDLERRPTTPRVLIATGTFPDPERWNEDFAALDPALIDALAAQGVCTIGIDTPSVDLFSSKDLPAHKRFLANDVAILEGLRLDAVPSGRYELIALPLPLVGFDASPVRAILRSL